MEKIDSLDIIEEKHPEEEDLEESWTTFYGEKPLEPEIEEFRLCLSSYPLCVQETNQQIVKYLNAMEEGNIQYDLDKQVNQGHHNYSELWFLTNH